MLLFESVRKQYLTPVFTVKLGSGHAQPAEIYVGETCVGIRPFGIYEGQFYAIGYRESLTVYLSASDYECTFSTFTHFHGIVNRRCGLYAWGCVAYGLQTTYGAKTMLRVTTMFRLPGSAPLGNDSNVLRPMMMGCPMVSDLNRFRSSDIWYRRSPRLPIAMSRVAASIIVISVILLQCL